MLLLGKIKYKSRKVTCDKRESQVWTNYHRSCSQRNPVQIDRMHSPIGPVTCQFFTKTIHLSFIYIINITNFSLFPLKMIVISPDNKKPSYSRWRHRTQKYRSVLVGIYHRSGNKTVPAYSCSIHTVWDLESLCTLLMERYYWLKWQWQVTWPWQVSGIVTWYRNSEAVSQQQKKLDYQLSMNNSVRFQQMMKRIIFNLYKNRLSPKFTWHIVLSCCDW